MKTGKDGYNFKFLKTQVHKISKKEGKEQHTHYQKKINWHKTFGGKTDNKPVSQTLLLFIVLKLNIRLLCNVMASSYTCIIIFCPHSFLSNTDNLYASSPFQLILLLPSVSSGFCFLIVGILWLSLFPISLRFLCYFSWPTNTYI